MKRNGKLKKFIIVFVSLILVAATVAGIWYYSTVSAEPVNVYAFHYMGMTEFWGDSQESYGYVQTDRVQTVFLSGTQTVTEILVAAGDEVKKGDVLMTFDTTLSDLALERKRLSVEKLKLQLEDAKKELRRINGMKPMVIPTPSDDEDKEENLGVSLTEPYQISTQSKYDGSSKDKALICWLSSKTNIDDEIFQALLEQAEKFQNLNVENSSSSTSAPSEESTTETSATEPEGTEPPATTPSEPEATDAPATEPEGTDEPATEPEPVKVDHFYVVFKVTKGDMSLGVRTFWQGIHVIVKDDGTFSFQFFDAEAFSDHTLAPNEVAPEKPEIDFGSGFTASQIAQMRTQQQKVIKDLEFNIKMADAEYRIMQTEVNDGKIYADVDGVVVSVLTEEEAQMTGQPLIKVSGGGGFYVEGTISELSRDTMTVGSEVTINDWSSGMVYTGNIQSIGDYPSPQNFLSGNGNPTATQYPFTVFVADNADLQSGSYVSIIYSAGSTENGIYLENPFLRTENGKSYVFVKGADGKLEQRFVTTGKSLWGSYTEILSGLTADDFLAFPYGTGVKSGAPTREAEIRELYE